MAKGPPEQPLNKTYQMVYSYTDEANNTGTTTRQIVLINSPFDKPFIIDSSPNDNPLVVDVLEIGDTSTGLRRDPNTNRFEPGVTAYKDFGGNLEPQNLTSKVTENEYIGGVLGAIDDTIVNYNLNLNPPDGTYVDPNGNPNDNNAIKGGILASLDGYDLTIGLTTDFFCKSPESFSPQMPSSNRLCITQEFGTVPPIEVGKAQVDENFAYHYGTPQQKELYGNRLKDVFYVRTREWKRAVVRRGVATAIEAINYLREASNISSSLLYYFSS